MRMKGRVAFVTGGASGLGEATARALAADGAKVAIFDVNLDGAQRVADGIGGLALSCDVASAQAAETAVAHATDVLGTPRVLVNCAGIAPPAKIVGKEGPQPLESFAKIVNTNLVGSFNMMRLVAARMQADDPVGEERGVIVSTASVAAYEGQIGQAAYAASKGGVIAMTLPAAREFARWGIRVTTIAPGIFGTPMLRSLSQEVQDALGASVPFPSRLGEPDEFADLVRSIIGNPMLNGEVIRLDGALRMQPI